MNRDSNFKDYLISIAKRVYDQLGTGHSECIYQKAYQMELNCQGFTINIEYPLPVEYCDSVGNQHRLGSERIDIYIHHSPTSVFTDNKEYNIILELKATSKTPGPVEEEQVRKYLRQFWNKGDKIPYGIIINFPQPNNAGVSDKIQYKIVNYSKNLN